MQIENDNNPLYIIPMENLDDKSWIEYGPILQDESINTFKLSLLDEDEINLRYSLGRIAIKNFEPGTDLYNRLTTLFYGTINFAQLE